jgi:hypothetical protein
MVLSFTTKALLARQVFSLYLILSSFRTDVTKVYPLNNGIRIILSYPQEIVEPL